MNEKQSVRRWLFIVCALIVFMVIFGGYVRLTRSGLSIVEWNVFSGIIPPIGEAQWQAEFAKYQQSPEFQKVNQGMSLAQYKFIFYNEYVHRLVARMAGLVVIIPFFSFLWQGKIRWRESGVYWLIVTLFGFQGFMGWYMVSSGLVDRPAVSHLRLTTHLLLAVLLLSIAFWQALKLGNPQAEGRRGWRNWLGFLMTGAIVIQIGYGGLVAGLKAGYVSNSWPLMYGYWLPPGLFSSIQPWWRNFIDSLPAVHYIHRWFAFLVLAVVVVLYVAAGNRPEQRSIRQKLAYLTGVVCLQIALGVSVILFSVPISLALIHQATALILYLIALNINYSLAYRSERQRTEQAQSIYVDPQPSLR